jgi:hypothetical protein
MNSELNNLSINDLNNNNSHVKPESENQKQNINALTNRYLYVIFIYKKIYKRYLIFFYYTSDFTYEKIKTIADWIMSKVEIKPKIGIVCGSGLGGLGDRLENPCIIPYSDIPSFPKSTGTCLYLILNVT